MSSSPTRNLAINIWWAPLTAAVNSSQFRCADDDRVEEGEAARYSLYDLKFETGEWFRYFLATYISRIGGHISFERLSSSLFNEHTDEKMIDREGFMLLDVDGDGRVTVKELLGLRAHHVHKAVRFAVVGEYLFDFVLFISFELNFQAKIK